MRGFFAEDEGPLGRRAVALDLELQVAEADLALGGVQEEDADHGQAMPPDPEALRREARHRANRQLAPAEGVEAPRSHRDQLEAGMRAHVAGGAGLRPRLGSRGLQLDATSSPNEDEVELWLDEAEAEAMGAIKAGGGPATLVNDSQAHRIVRGRVEMYVAGLVAFAHARAGGVGTNEDGQKLIDDWKAWLRELKEDSRWMLATLDDGGSEGDSATVLRSHATDRSLGLEDRELIPSFKISKALDGENF